MARWLVTAEVIMEAPSAESATVMASLQLERSPATIVVYQVLACPDDYDPNEVTKALPL